VTATRQLPLDLPHRTARGRGDFLVTAANADALAALDGWRDWPEARMLLIGPRGAGKSHLAAIWAETTGAQTRAAAGLAACDLPALADGPALVIEDAETLAASPADQTAMFHLYNLVAARGSALMITASGPVAGWGLTLADLASRLMTLPVTRIAPPDDALLSAVLVKLFADRQIAVPPAVIAFAQTRMERSIDAARDLVAALDALSLAEGRPVSRSMAAKLLDNAGATDQD
jgi:chromosomal replication initiation ATPase DnaA